ncbi:MAG: protein kinase domain-containing protein [Pyrinomonadaceae bacterium]
MISQVASVQQKKRLKGEVHGVGLEASWILLCRRFLPVEIKDSVWRISRHGRPNEPHEGWKLHISATILDACDVLEKVAPLLMSLDVQFKAPDSLEELSKINCGLQYGYHQVGKFITVYPSSDRQAIEIAAALDQRTRKFFPVRVPYDEQYSPGSSVFYRYGAFAKVEMTDEKGETFQVVRNDMGEFVRDDRCVSVPSWVSDPFPNAGKPSERKFKNTPLGNDYLVYRAITQRGKGGTYEAFDTTQRTARLSIVKEGRKYGELSWTEQDGYSLVHHEYSVLREISKRYDGVPRPFASFEVHGNFYFAMEFVEGKSLKEWMEQRVRRFSFKRILELAIGIARILERIHDSGWIWNDCKPGNLIIAPNGTLRPIDFETAYTIDSRDRFDWQTRGFSRPRKFGEQSNGRAADLFSLGAVIYFLLTGHLYDSDDAVRIAAKRRSVPEGLVIITEELLAERHSKVDQVVFRLENLLDRQGIKG